MFRDEEAALCSPNVSFLDVHHSSAAAAYTFSFIGQAGHKTKDVMDKAIGKVLFIDEAYGLNPKHGGHVASFMQEVKPPQVISI